MPKRPPFIVAAADVPEQRHRYPDSAEEMAPYRPLGRAAGLLELGVRLVRLLPGTRTSYPHAESAEEEFAYVIEGEVSAWIDGEIHPMKAGDFVAFPAGTGIAHTLINDGDREAVLLAGGHAYDPKGKVFYPKDPQRRADMVWSRSWDDAPARPRGPHDGKPRPR